ncbi:ORF49 [Ovine gammaherpesvirus 2]|uniref:ORF49 n=1 Tax=Ovine gammaherpesvirus 2 TaxID=10398 RepID=Q2VSJ2_9GAMA|nr:ORF49 [Ovine gammaherpesvirus 2]AAX58084.1 ORF49 [Ovine gammaherpesvirus 2]ABB22267.1 hypothetical protein OvHV-2gp47 [Ovine gammaherpesvirus 2]WOZ69493.1 ORF49 transcriptional control protein [Ovine gammaherpesvirus 2]
MAGRLRKAGSADEHPDKYFVFKNKAFSLKHLFRYFYADPGQLRAMLEDVAIPRSTRCRRDSKHLILCLKRCMFILKVYKVFAERKTSERGIVPCILVNLRYHLEGIKGVVGEESQMWIEPLLEALYRQGAFNLEKAIEEGLPGLLAAEYALIPDQGVSLSQGCHTWVSGRLLPTVRGSARRSISALFSDYHLSVPSITALSVASKKLFDKRNTSTKELTHRTFNLHYNHIVFWTAVLKMYQDALWENELLKRMDLLRDMLHIELKPFLESKPSPGSKKSPVAELCKCIHYLMTDLLANHSEMIAVQLFALICECETFHTNGKAA